MARIWLHVGNARAVMVRQLLHHGNMTFSPTSERQALPR